MAQNSLHKYRKMPNVLPTCYLFFENGARRCGCYRRWGPVSSARSVHRGSDGDVSVAGMFGRRRTRVPSEVSSEEPLLQQLQGCSRRQIMDDRTIRRTSQTLSVLEELPQDPFGQEAGMSLPRSAGVPHQRVHKFVPLGV